MYSLIALILSIPGFLNFSGHQTYTPEQVVAYWQTEEKNEKIAYKPITFFVDKGLPSDYLGKIKKLMGEDPSKDVRLYFQMASIISRGRTHYKTYQVGEQLKDALDLLELATTVKSDHARAWFYRHLGDLCAKNGDIEKAVYFLLISVDMHRNLGNDVYSRALLCHMYNALAAVLYRTHDYKKSIHYSKIALTYFDDHSQKPIFEDYYVHYYFLLHDLLGAAYKKSGQYKNSLTYYNKIVSFTQTSDKKNAFLFDFWKNLTLGNIGQVYLAQNDTEKALPLIQTALKSSIENEDFANVCEWYKDIAKIYYLNGNDRLALLNARKSEELLGHLASGNAIAPEVYELLYSVNERMGNLKGAIVYLKLAEERKQQLNLILEKSKLEKAAIELSYHKIVKESEQKEVKIQQLRLLRNSLIGLAALTAIVVWYFINQKQQKQKKTLQILALEKELKDKEISGAKDLIEVFKKNIKEKETFIQDLEDRAVLDDKNQGMAIANLKKISLVTEDGWQKFKGDFSVAYPQFLPMLRTTHPNLTGNDERLAMLIFLKLDNAEIGLILGIGKDSVAKSKRRLKARLGVDSPQILETYVINIC